MAHSHPQQVHGHGVAQQQGEAEQDPGEVGSVEGEETKEVHPDVGISPGPDVDQHYCEGLTPHKISQSDHSPPPYLAQK